MAANPTHQKNLKEQIFTKITESINRERMRFGILPLRPDHGGTYALQDIMMRAPDLNTATENFDSYFSSSFKPQKYLYQPYDTAMLLGTQNKLFETAITDYNIQEKLLLFFDMIFASHRDEFLNKQFTSIAFEAVWSFDRIKLLVLLTQQVLSVETVSRDSAGDFRIQGYIHNPSLLLYGIKLVDASGREFCVGSNRISISNDRSRFQIDFPNYLVRGLDLQCARPPILEFYHLNDNGNFLSSQSLDLMSGVFGVLRANVQLVYCMPFVFSQAAAADHRSEQELVPETVSRRRDSRFFEAEDTNFYQNQRSQAMDISGMSSNNRGNMNRRGLQERQLTRARTSLWNSPGLQFGRTKDKRSTWYKNRSNSPRNDRMLQEDESFTMRTRYPLFTNFSPANNNNPRFRESSIRMVAETDLSMNTSFSVSQGLMSELRDSSNGGIKTAFSTGKKAAYFNNSNMKKGPFSKLPDQIQPHVQIVQDPKIFGNPQSHNIRSENMLIPPELTTANGIITVVPEYATNQEISEASGSYNNSNHETHSNQEVQQIQWAPKTSEEMISKANSIKVKIPNERKVVQEGDPEDSSKLPPLYGSTRKTSSNESVLINPPTQSQTSGLYLQRLPTPGLLMMTRPPNFSSIPNLIPYSGFPVSRQSLFTKERGDLHKAGKSDAERIEALLPHKPPKRNEYFIELYNAMENSDVVLQTSDKEIKAHKEVLMQSSWFKGQLLKTKSQANELIMLRLPEQFKTSVLEKILKFLYFSTIDDKTLSSIDIITARDIFLLASVLNLGFLMKLLLCKIILPNCTEELCIELLIDSQNWEIYNDGLAPIWKALKEFCKEFFATHSKSILKKYRSKLVGMGPELLLDLVNRAYLRLEDEAHLSDLLELLIEAGYAKDIYGILISESKKQSDYFRFDSKSLPCVDAILQLNPLSCYETALITVDPVDYISKARKHDLFNHSELSLKCDSYISGPLVSKSKIPATIEEIEPDYIFKHALTNCNCKTIITELFYSESQAWSLVIDIDKEQNVSIFLQERGAKPTTGKSVIGDFTSVRFTFQIEDEGNNYRSTTFFTFPKNQNLAVGHRKFFSLPSLVGKDGLLIKVWIEEFQIYAACLHHLSSKFADLWMKEQQLFEQSHDLKGGPTKNTQYISKASNGLSVYELNPFDVYYLMISDNLQINLEKTLIQFFKE